MRKIVRLTESDLVRLVKRVINEQSVTRKTLPDFGKWAMETENQCPESTGAWDYCPKGTWKYIVKDNKFKFFSDKNEVVLETNETPDNNNYKGPVNDLKDLANWVVTTQKVPYYNGIWKWHRSKGIQSYGGFQSVNMYDKNDDFMGTISFRVQ